MKLDPANILRLLKSHTSGLSAKEMLQHLGQKQKRKAQLRKLLRHMAKEGWVVKDNNRYLLTKQGQAAFVPFSEAQERQTNKPQPRPHRQNQGFFKASTLSLIERGSAEELKIAEGTEHDFLTGDLLGFDREETGAVVSRFFERSIEQLLGRLRFEDETLYFDPLSANFPRGFRAGGLKPEAKLDGQKAMAKVTSYPDARVMIQGLVSENEADPAAYRSILAQNNIFEPFPKGALAQAKSYGAEPRLDADRADLRHLAFVTIDGADAKDFDDAVYGEETEAGQFRLFVSIADVGQYVTYRSDLDKEAAKRGTSVYLPGTVVPMLPEELSNGLCSLNPEVNRLTLTAEMLLDEEGKPLDFKVYESVIKSHARLTYGEVDQFFESGELDREPKLKELLTLYRKWAQVLRQKRQKRGAINFSLPEAVFDFSDSGEVLGIHQTFQTEAQKLIEQFMLEANENVGQFCQKKNLPILWRNHPPPLPAKQEQLREILWNLNIKVPFLHRGKDYNQVLDQAQDSTAKVFVENALLRSMSLATYGEEREGHFGLAATHYLHFTSPIRRYPDLVVHRAIKAYLAGQRPPGLTRFLGAQTSERERMAKLAERDAVKLKRMTFMARHIGQDYLARITGLNRAGIFCEIAEPYVEGFIPYRGLIDDDYRVDDDNLKALGRRTKRILAMGQPLVVMLTGLQVDYKSLNFAWIAWADRK